GAAGLARTGARAVACHGGGGEAPRHAEGASRAVAGAVAWRRANQVLPDAAARSVFDVRPRAPARGTADSLPGARSRCGLDRGQGVVPLSPEQSAHAIASLAADRKALDLVQLDLRGMIGYTDYFVICTGRSDRQVKAIHDAIHEGMKHQYGVLPERVEGL